MQNNSGFQAAVYKEKKNQIYSTRGFLLLCMKANTIGDHLIAVFL
jgi:hypothetical protein